jgi:hypothetical protein
MFFIYSLSLKDFTVKLYDFCRTKDGVNDLLDTVAKNFVRHEEGERRAESPYREIPDDEITEEGYFLRHSDEKPDQIDVYVRKIQVAVGRVWNSYDVSCKKVMHFAVTEASLGLPIECTGKGVTVQTFSTAKESQQQGDHLSALKERLVKQRERVDKQINAEVDLQEVQDSDTDKEVVLQEVTVEDQYSDTDKEVVLQEVTVEDQYSDTDEEELENPIIRLKRMISFEDAKNLIDNLSGDHVIPTPPTHPTPPTPPTPPTHLLTNPGDDYCSSPVHHSTPQSVQSPFSSFPHTPVLSRWGCPHEAYDSSSYDSISYDSSSYDSNLSDSYYSDSDCENAQDTDLRD